MATFKTDSGVNAYLTRCFDSMCDYCIMLIFHAMYTAGYKNGYLGYYGR